MNVLLIGSGGREHALAWKLADSPQVRLFFLPGNPGMAELGTILAGRPEGTTGVIEQARRSGVDLVVIGPEAPLAAGLADDLRAAGMRVFGPSAAAARIESSKAFAKAFMERHAIPTASSETFSELAPALAYLNTAVGQHPDAVRGLVIKASGLAAGKGVFLPDTFSEAEAILQDLLEAGRLGEAGRTVLVEERLTGREVSVLAFCDGHTIAAMPPVQDHKRLLDGDEGPNTGGMGAYAPSPACPPSLVGVVVERILQPAVDGLREEGYPFVGVLYAGLMLTDAGPRVLEFNARFGDPETQVIMPLLDSDLLDILLACTEGRLVQVAPSIRWRPGGAACVILAGPDYPEKPAAGQPIAGLDQLPDETWAFHSGTSLREGRLVATGGRVLAVTGRGGDLHQAIERAYAGVAQVSFAGMHYRQDIGRDAGSRGLAADPVQTAYEAAGVSISAGNQAVELMRAAVRSTYTPQVLSDVGAFGGLFHAAGLHEMRDPVLVASTDGIGTKVDLAARLGRYNGLGLDIVNHCINDILVQGARPLFFLDYFAAGQLDPSLVAELVGGMSAACREAGCALLGGETAEMPGVYTPGHFDVAGTIVGVVEREALLPRRSIQPGDLLLGLASSGPHTNGYSLIRKVFASPDLSEVLPPQEASLGELLLAPHRSYLPLLKPFLTGENGSPLKALAHITGGGFFDNLPRVLPAGCGACVETSSWPVPPLFELIQRQGRVDRDQMYHVFNMGIGMVAVIAPESLAGVQAAITEKTWVIGEVTAGEGVRLV